MIIVRACSVLGRGACGWHCMAESRCCVYLQRVSLPRGLWPQSSPLYEASTRTLVVLDADGWKGRFNARNARTWLLLPSPVVPEQFSA